MASLGLHFVIASHAARFRAGGKIFRRAASLVEPRIVETVSLVASK
jgi:hypothetical protein